MVCLSVVILMLGCLSEKDLKVSNSSFGYFAVDCELHGN